jgi:hypothetical protein
LAILVRSPLAILVRSPFAILVRSFGLLAPKDF